MQGGSLCIQMGRLWRRSSQSSQSGLGAKAPQLKTNFGDIMKKVLLTSVSVLALSAGAAFAQSNPHGVVDAYHTAVNAVPSSCGIPLSSQIRQPSAPAQLACDQSVDGSQLFEHHQGSLITVPAKATVTRPSGRLNHVPVQTWVDTAAGAMSFTPEWPAQGASSRSIKSAIT